MLLHIQSDESLRSFTARNIFLNWSDPDIKDLDRISKFSIRSYEVKALAATMGWLGCFGFNHLLHNHTFYPRYSIFKSNQDISYSHSEYISSLHTYESNIEPAAFCPECVKEDLAVLGFSYWRRLFRSDIKVCAKHNVYLVNKCPFCDKPFTHKGHSLDVMWKGCAGRHLGESSSLENDDPLELKKSKTFLEASRIDFVISIEAALLAINERFLSFNALGAQCTESNDELRSRVGSLLDIMRKYSVDNRWILRGEFSDQIWDSILLLYDGFDQFLEDVKRFKYKSRTVSSLWSTYCAAGIDSAQYVEEDYVHGVGHWSCPHPSPYFQLTLGNGTFGRPELYPCCNFPPPRRKGRQRQPTRVDFPPPGIPVLANHEDIIPNAGIRQVPSKES